jgi:plasmid stabilization system protein ParE
LTGSASLTAEAQADIDAATRWYADKGANVADRFLDAVEEVLKVVGSHPRHAPVIVNDLRRRNLKGWPYGAWYLERPYGALVVGVLHHARDPAVILTRPRP